MSVAAELETIAAYAVAASWSSLPAAVRRRAAVTLLDLAACATTAAEEPVVRRLAWGRLVDAGAPGVPPVATDPLLFGFAAAAGELDEANFTTDQHPANHVAPVVVALGEALGATVEQTMTAFVVGYEVAARFGAAIRLRPSISAHGTHGLFGGAVAAALLLGLDHDGVLRALRIAGSQVPANGGSARAEGAESYHAAFGLSAERAIAIARLAAAGVDGASDAIDVAFGGVLAETIRPGVLTAGLGVDHRVARNYFKTFPCCADVHAALFAVDDLLADGPLDPDRVAAVEVRTFAAGCDVLEPVPGSPLLARFSLPWLVAERLRHGPIAEDSFVPDRLGDGSTAALAAAVTGIVDPVADAGFPVRLSAEVRVVDADSLVRVGRADAPSESPDRDLDRVESRATAALEAAGTLDYWRRRIGLG